MILSLLGNDLFLITSIILIWANMILYALEDFHNRSYMLMFLVAFFTFLIGRQALERFGLHTIVARFSDEINIQVEVMLLISLISLSVVYIFPNHNSNNIIQSNTMYASNQTISIRRASVAVFYATYLANIYNVLDVVKYVFANGYLRMYTSYSSSVPFIIEEIGEMNNVAFWIYLSTMPTKKECRTPILFYIIYLVFTLATGSRGKFVIGLLMIIAYYMLRANINNRNEMWFGKKEILFCIALIPTIMILMIIVEIIRSNGKIEEINIMDTLTRFIYEQGTSVNMIKRSLVYNSFLPKNRIYSFGSTISLVLENPLSVWLGASVHSGNSVDTALNGYSMAHAVSYFAYGSLYLSGEGVGSSYIAEVFHDFGYIGIIIVNILYSFIIRKANNFRHMNVWKSALLFLIMENMIGSPRGNADRFIVTIITPHTWITMILVYIISRVIYVKHFSVKNPTNI